MKINDGFFCLLDNEQDEEQKAYDQLSREDRLEKFTAIMVGIAKSKMTPELHASVAKTQAQIAKEQASIARLQAQVARGENN